MNWDALLAAFDRYGDDFRFGVQSNGTVLSDEQYDVLMQRGVAIGLSLDCAVDEIVTRTRKTWDGHSIYAKVVALHGETARLSQLQRHLHRDWREPASTGRRPWNSSTSAASPPAC